MIPVLLMLCADLVLRNGKIVTLDPAKPQVEAIAITGGKIVAVGSNAEMGREIQPVDESHRFERAAGDSRVH